MSLAYGTQPYTASQPAPSACGTLRWQITIATAAHVAVGSYSYAGNETSHVFTGFCGTERHSRARLVTKLNAVFIIT